MGIRFTPEYNKRIASAVRNFNRTRKRAELAGVPKNRLPRAVKVSELKASYKTRSDLNKAISHLENFSRKATNERISIGDSKTTKWNYQYVKENQDLAKQYFENEYKRVNKRVARFPGERNYLNTISAKIKTLGKDISKLDDKEYQASLNAVNEFLGAASVRKSQYRGFLSEVELVMDTLNIDSKRKDYFFKKFEQLTPNQFLYAYDNNDIIARVYELYFKRKDNGEIQLNTDAESANEIIDSLFEQIDVIIQDAKLNSV